MSLSAIQPHNLTAAMIWNSGGPAYDRLSATVADAIEHCVLRLEPQPVAPSSLYRLPHPGHARRVGARGAKVTGIDLGADLIAAAKAAAAEAGLKIDFRVGDAEELPFEDHSFDAITSTFGVMFVRDPEAAAAELARVCRKGGRIGLATWATDGAIAGLFKVMQPYMPESPVPTASPFAWGSKERVRQLLGAAFDLRFETGATVLRAPTGLDVWELFVKGYGPTKTLAASLDAKRRESLKLDFIAYHEGFKSELGVVMLREYLVTIGVRK